MVETFSPPLIQTFFAPNWKRVRLGSALIAAMVAMACCTSRPLRVFGVTSVCWFIVDLLICNSAGHPADVRQATD
jgi:hypothetical protein